MKLLVVNGYTTRCEVAGRIEPAEYHALPEGIQELWDWIAETERSK